MTDTTEANAYVDVVDEVAFDDGDPRVLVRRVRTPKGERLEVRTVDDVIRIDALGLESLSWQDPDVFASWLDGEYDGVPDASDAEARAEFTISNEYADVVVRAVRDADTPHVVIESPKKHFSLRADALALAALAAQDTDVFSDFLRTPHGPGGHAH